MSDSNALPASSLPDAPAPAAPMQEPEHAAPTALAAADSPASDAPADTAASLANDVEVEVEVDADADTDAAQGAQSQPGAEAASPGHAGPALTPAAAAALLREHFPALFSGPAKPFKLRIQQDIQARAPGVFSRATLSAYFRRHTTSTAYLIGMSKSDHRFDLDGQPAGELSDEHKQAALAELARRRQITREREQQAQAQQRATQREAQRAEMAAQAEVQQARQARAQLLRDFQRTTLTLANFCVLKGMTPEVLNPLLEQAKKEAAEVPPVSQRDFDDRRGPRSAPGGATGPRDTRGPRDPQGNGPRPGAGRPDGERAARPGGDDRRPGRPPDGRRPARAADDRRPPAPANGQRPGRTSDDRPSTRTAGSKPADPDAGPRGPRGPGRPAGQS